MPSATPPTRPEHGLVQGLLGSGSFGFVVACKKRDGFGATEEAAVAIKVFSKADVEIAPDRLKEMKAEKEVKH